MASVFRRGLQEGAKATLPIVFVAAQACEEPADPVTGVITHVSGDVEEWDAVGGADCLRLGKVFHCIGMFGLRIRKDDDEVAVADVVLSKVRVVAVELQECCGILAGAETQDDEAATIGGRVS